MKTLCALASVVFLTALHAETLRVVEVRELVKDADELLKQEIYRGGMTLQSKVVYPTVTVSEGAAAWLAPPIPTGERNWSAPQGGFRVALRLQDETPVEGTLFLRDGKDFNRLKPFPFKYDPASSESAGEDVFNAVRKEHDERLAKAALPGAAWFRHRAGGTTTVEPGRVEDDNLGATFRMVSGSRAVAENLALDRDLILGGVEGTPVELDSLKGVTVQALDWTGKLKPGEVTLDPLASLIPHDQHALFAPSLDDLFELIDVIEDEGAPFLQSFDASNPYRELPSRYRVQMGLDVPNMIAARMPVSSVAVTGGDPFFPSGTDVAVVLASETPDLLLDALEGMLTAKAKTHGATAPEGSIYRGFQTEDRSFSAWFAKFDGAVVVANSPVALKRIEQVVKGEEPSLASLDEFKFFRQRYPLGAEETAYLFLSDPTIRRWAGPRVRIAASRRIRATAALGELTSRKIDGEGGEEMYDSLLGKSDSSGAVVRSEVFNTLGFLTPVSELEFTTVTPAEAAAYERWRNGYENGWALAFDPIGIRLKLDEKSRALDLTLMPLTVGSDYRDWIEVTGTKPPEKGAIEAHRESLAFLSFAIDSESKTFREFGEWSQSMIPALKVKPLAWVGDSISLYLDDGFFWKALQTGDTEELLSSNYLRLPIGIRIDSRSSVRLAVFLSGLRAFIDQSAPDLLTWQQRKHGDQTYLAVLSSGEDDPSMQGGVFYAAMKGALLLSLDEKVLQHAIDREKGIKTTGRHVQAEVNPQFLHGLGGAFGSTLLERQRLESWAAIPVLNEWHRLAADTDPVVYHASHFQENIYCPGGEGYRWNESARTMESVTFGYPGDPRGEEVGLAIAQKFSRITAGLTFEDDGLRLRLDMDGSSPRRRVLPAPEVEIPEGFPQPSDLIPVKVGTTWKYRVTETWAERPYAKSVKLSEITPRDNGSFVRYREEIKFPDDEELQIHDVGYLLDGGYRWVESKTEDSSRTYTTPMPVLPVTLAPGLRFGGEHRSVSTFDEKASNEVGVVRARVVGLEDVTVPAGEFEKCVRIDSESDYLVNGSIGRVSDSVWYAPGVGVVKMTWKDDFDNGTEELESFEIGEEP